MQMVIETTVDDGTPVAETLSFSYDASGMPMSVIYNGTAYYTVNLQGDVMAIVDASGTSVVSYAYDAWGKVLYSAGSMAGVNSIRYRGYYYDGDNKLAKPQKGRHHFGACSYFVYGAHLNVLRMLITKWYNKIPQNRKRCLYAGKQHIPCRLISAAIKGR